MLDLMKFSDPHLSQRESILSLASNLEETLLYDARVMWKIDVEAP
ncbi:hypothetical protein SAMN05444141_105291 [Pseudovibrio denitrificans]|uniref:Uncharacterized protein n=1 Tax=Pseudovibrio denitrificans TaxID=258256 RepID=A0A1I7C7Z8_9HYPH|nr:hypothetical protein SAMN05444141_105291 [Pseudovibrio denitrificans]